MNKEQLLQTLRDEQTVWEQFLAEIPPNLRQRPDVYGTWSVKDVVGHVAVWERFMTAMIRAEMRNDKATPHEIWGEFVPTPDLADDALNEWMAQQIGSRSFDEVLGMQREVRMKLLGTVQAMSEHMLTAPEVTIRGIPWKKDHPLWQEIASMSYNHIRDHMDGLKAALEPTQYWDHEATTFDEEPDHGLRDTVIRHAWTNLLASYLPTLPSKVLDIGCGTGSLSLLLAELGHEVIGIDFSLVMLAQAKAKASSAGHTITFRQMDAAQPSLEVQQFDVLFCRHLLWALTEPKRVLERWLTLLKPDGRLILIEGFWHTGSGLHVQEIVDLLPTQFKEVVVYDLSNQSSLWGKVVIDERFAIMAKLPESVTKA